MEDLIKERQYKIDRILEEYDKQKTLVEVAEMFGMDKKHVSWVTQQNDYEHIKKIVSENKRLRESISADIDYEEFAYLDQYAIENFKKQRSY